MKKKAMMKKSTPSPSSSSKTKQTNHKPSLLQQHFEDTVRPCIDLIDSLRSLGVDKDLSLPAIAVIGDQSSGKSSVLEALSGVALPRGSGIVTRCPLELKMRKTMKGDQWRATISYNVQNGDVRQFTKSHCKFTIDDPSQVEQHIKQAQNEMAGVGVGISEDLISLEIASPDVPDLTLIDLPGIARVAVQRQPVNIGDQIKKLIQKVIAKQQTICLVVVPCNVDIATTEALKMAQEVDPEGERTLGILTKPDLLDRGTEQTAVDIVHNKVIPLKKGYMIVRCRGQQEIVDQVSLMEVTRREKEFFKDHTHFRTLYDDGQATIPKLAEKLTLELVNHIERSLPALDKEIAMKLKETQSELDRCGSGPPSDPAERMHFLFDRVMAFTRNVISLTKGEDVKCGDNVFAVLREEFGKWSLHIDKSGQNFNKKIEKEVAAYEMKYRGKELPGFINYKTFETMVQEQIKLLEEPAVQKLRDVADVVKKVLIELAQLSFVGFPNLIKVAKTKIESIKQQKEPVAESMLRTQFKMEMIIYTQDRTYSSALKKRKLDNESVNGFGSLPAAFSTQLSSKTCLGSEATLSELMFHLKSYYEIASQRLADQIPLVIRFYILEEAASQLQRDMLQMLQDKDKTEFLLHEDSGVNDRRTTLQSRLKRLMRARTRLLEF